MIVLLPYYITTSSVTGEPGHHGRSRAAAQNGAEGEKRRSINQFNGEKAGFLKISRQTVDGIRRQLKCRFLLPISDFSMRLYRIALQPSCSQRGRAE
jgi:hypothetical protein